MANLVIPAWRGQIPPTQLPPVHYYNSGPNFYQPPAHNPVFNPGPMRNPQPSESDDLNPLEIQEPLYPQGTPSQQTVPTPPVRNTETQPTHPLEPKKPTPIHFLEREPEMPKYSGGRKTIKIKPLDKDLCFDGTNMPIEKFIKRYEAAGETDGATPQDLARQIIPFIKGMDLKDEVEEMSGYEDSNWEQLKKQLLNRFGSSLPLVKYTRHDLKHLVNSAIKGGGIKTLEHFKIFRTKFEAITHYLVRMGYSSNLEESRECLLESLSPDLESSVTRELIRDNMILASKDVSRPRGIPLGLETLQSQGREGFLSASRLYSLKAERDSSRPQDSTVSRPRGIPLGLETLQSQGREVSPRRPRDYSLLAARLYNLVDQEEGILALEVVQPRRPGGFGRRGCTTSTARIPSSWSTRLYNLAARRIPTWSTRLYSLAGQDSLLLVDKVVQPRRQEGMPARL
ncbi:hypothetical protein PGT21_011554 [Puccinia graminis f. sp. tritici]|uniref:Uncharacterized protein n=1 Tax=Puccinia graminis f. sp. tritici TaxID=56615 RepID=A0A5B0MKE2_PUCGR|nr:hypothetical protein PGT21_011554 [Puccinia graminis f. sp. tritici]